MVPRREEKSMGRRWMTAALLLASAGCNRQDAECLGRIGTLVGQRLEHLKPTAVGPDANVGRPPPTPDGPAEAGGDEPQK